MAEDYVEHAFAPFGQSEPGRVNGPKAMRGTAEWLLALMSSKVLGAWKS